MFFTVLDGTTPFEDEERLVGWGKQRVVIIPGHPFIAERLDLLILNGCVVTEVTSFRACAIKDVTPDEIVDWGTFKFPVGAAVFRDTIDDMADPYVNADQVAAADNFGEVCLATVNAKTGACPELEKIISAANFAFANVFMSRVSAGVATPESKVTVIALGPVLVYDQDLMMILRRLKERAEERIDFTDVPRREQNLQQVFDDHFAVQLLDQLREKTYKQLKELLENGM